MPDTKPTKQEIADATKELMEAMLEVREAGEHEDKAKLRKIKAYKRLSLAREAIRTINYFNY